MRCAVCPGSFDPVTVGHLDVVRRAASLYDRVYLCVMHNEEKGEGFLPPEERLQLLRLAAAPFPNVTADLWEGLCIDYAHRVSASVLVKGIRSEDDLRYELSLAAWNRAHAPDVETVFLPAGAEFTSVSSSLVRRRLANGEPVDDLVPPDTAEPLYRFYRKKGL